MTIFDKPVKLAKTSLTGQLISFDESYLPNQTYLFETNLGA